MEVVLKKKDEEIDDLPGNNEPDTKAIEEEKRRLELENAEMRGQLKERNNTVKVTPQAQHEQVKQRVLSDVNGLDEEKFQEIYKMGKSQAMMTLMERDTAISKSEARLATADAKADVEMVAKYGSDYYTYRTQIDEAISDLSDEAKGDSVKLARAKERILISLKNAAPPKIKNDEKKRIINDFEKPTPGIPVDKKMNDEIPDVYRPLSKAFGIHSEKERQEYMQLVKDGEFVPMNMGGGVWFKHPDRGFEHVEKSA